MAQDLLTDPFQPQRTQTPQGSPNIAGEWAQALNDPQMKTALLQFGISLLQPPSFGDTTGSQIGRAFGGAGEALGRREAADLARQEAESKDALRASQATAAEARAEAAQARAGSTSERNQLAAGRLDVAREKLGLSQILDANRRRVDIMKAYSKARAEHDSRKLLEPDLPPFPDLATWAQQVGVGSMLSPDVSGGAPQLQTFAPAPPNPVDRAPNTVYQTPRGPLRWTGTGWVQP